MKELKPTISMTKTSDTEMTEVHVMGPHTQTHEITLGKEAERTLPTGRKYTVCTNKIMYKLSALYVFIYGTVS